MALQYLLSPTFQFVNTAGKPMTGGAYLEVYVHGTRNKYFCASDFNGTLHPFRIPLDSLGSNIVLAQDGQAYDVYVYNRYGNLMMSRYNITPGSGGGGIGGIIYSSDGSVQVIPTDNGIDLSVNGVRPTVLKVGAAPLGTDGQFVFDLLQLEGEGLSVDNAGRIRMQPGWYHYDVTVELAWEENPRNESRQVSLYTTLSRSVIDFDLSFRHSETIQFSGDVHCVEEGAQMVFGVSGMPTGLVASVTDAGMHSITGKTGDGSRYLAGEGITIDANNYISADLDVVQHKLTAGTNIEIVGNTINATAAPQQQADWAVTDTTSPQFILNKPELARVATTGSYNDLTNKPTIPAAQVPSDWDAASGVSRILNKPDLSVYARSSDLATVATSGSYDDLSDKPAIPAPQVNADWNSNSGVTKILNKPDLGVFARSADLAEVATTGDYDDLRNKPSIPAAQVNADWNSNSGVSQILNKPNLATVATTGNYNDLSGRPSIPAAQVNADWNASSGVAAILNKPALFSGDYDDLTDKPDLSVYAEKSELAPVATSGSYDDLTDKPSIPSFTQDQQAAIDSGINSTKVGAYDTHVADTTIHVTAADKTAWNGKEDAANKKQSLDPTSTTDFPSSKAAADFVNSSIATQTAKFLGNMTLTDLGLTYPATNVQIASALNSYTWPAGVTVTNNDYVYVEIQNPQTTSVDDRVERYKYSDGLASWGYEYTLNNSSFTAAEIAAIDSGITAADKSAYDAHVADGTIHVTAADKTAWDGKQDAIGDLNTIRSGASAGATAVQPGDLATVATTGNYSDLNGKPTLFSGDYDDLTDKPDLSVYAESADLAAVATSGAYADLSGTPTINNVPAVTSSDDNKVLKASYSGGVGSYSWEQAPASQVQSDWAETDTSDPSFIENKPVPKALVAGQGISISESSSALTITNTATPPTVDQTYDASSANAQSGVAVASGIAGAIGDLPSNLTAVQILALKQALGCDETVLYENSSGYAIKNGLQLPETLLNFERILMYVDNTGVNSNGTPAAVIVPIQVNPYPNGTISLCFGNGHNLGSTYKLSWKWTMTLSGTTLTVTASQYWGQNNTSWTQGDNLNDATVYKIIGIHRIASN